MGWSPEGHKESDMTEATWQQAHRASVCMYHSEFVPSLAEGHLGCFQDWASMSQPTSVRPFV